MKKKRGYQTKRHALVGYAFMAPWIIGFLLLTAWPFFNTFYLSFFNVQRTVAGWEQTFAGAANYNTAFLGNPYFVTNLIAFMVMQAAYAPAIVVISFMLALLLNRNIKGRGVFRALFFLPVIVMSGPVMHQLMTSGGLTSVGIETMTLYNMVYQFAPWLANALVFLFENYSVVLWFTGIPIILFISGLQKIDTGILEAARIDSASNWQILWKITVPILKPTIMVGFILTVVQLAGYTLNPVLPMIHDAINETHAGLGLGSAFAWVYSAVVLVLIGFVYVLLKEPKESNVAVKLRQRTWADRR
ncbi:MAG: sugar ABC transporter permease [Defluviitaleaceae bacterium]|nr:sugar ABC transporter permease [Defluviitaleaceae bacterium]